MTANKDEAIEKDREEKKSLVVKAISAHCNDSSKFQDLRNIGQALQDGDELQLNILSGGYTNFSYRAFLKKNPSIQLYAKLSFSRALWNPDPTVHYDLIRTTNEYKMMELFYNINPEAVAVPYLCLDIDGMKLLVTQWSEADEQWANQFIDGSVDTRIVPKLARDMAKLHCMDCDPDFNIGVRDCVLSVFPDSIERTKELLNSQIETGRLAKFLQELGQETCDLIFENCIKDYKTPERLIHNDTHVFNILVEKKPNIESLEEFAEMGKYILCDWEMAMAGPIGHDVGLFFAFPVACILAHAINGHREVVESILDILDAFWKDYASALREEGQHNDAYLCRTYRSAIGWTGFFLYVALYNLNVMMEFLPLDGFPSSVEEHVRDSVGYIGFQFMRLAFGNYAMDASLESLHSIFRSTIEVEVAHLVPKRPRRNRRSSVLRTSGRRFSDASSVFGSFSLRGSFSTHLLDI